MHASLHFRVQEKKNMSSDPQNTQKHVQKLEYDVYDEYERSEGYKNGEHFERTRWAHFRLDIASALERVPTVDGRGSAFVSGEAAVLEVVF